MTSQSRTLRILCALFFAALLALVILVILNVIGVGVGKWVNNLGGIGTSIMKCTILRG